jgi:hypothetical protein
MAISFFKTHPTPLFFMCQDIFSTFFLDKTETGLYGGSNIRIMRNMLKDDSLNGGHHVIRTKPGRESGTDKKTKTQTRSPT